VPSPLDALQLEFMRTALVELCVLAVAGGILGSFIVLRRLAFFAHAVGTATFPGLVIADAGGFSPQLAALAVALGYTGGVERAARRRPGRAEAATAVLLAAALALGTILASDVLQPGAGVDRLLFGSLIGLSSTDVALSAAAAAVAAAASLVAGRAWLLAGFDPEGARAVGVPLELAEGLLLALIAVATVTALPAVGALLTTAIFIVPAATARLWARSVGALVAGAVAIALAEGVLALYVAYWLDVPVGPVLAVLGAAAYALAAAAERGLR
jgi:manganese/iron transport system permease protein